MTRVFRFSVGDSPLLVSVPHDGRNVPAGIRETMTPEAASLPDTDWHVATLYEFSKSLGAGVLTAEFSRYVVDLNRPADDGALYPGQVSTGICPRLTFAGEPIYVSGAEVTAEERDRRVRDYWRPYHDKLETELEALKDKHGYALLWDAHSIASRVPRLFDGRLPALNIGTNGGASCPADVVQAVAGVAAASRYSSVVDGRFRGGYITRRYGDADGACYAIQLEMAQRCYMDERTLVYDRALAARARETLERMFSAFIDSGRQRAGA